MKLFVKHLLRSLRSSPVQSILIVLTVAFSMAAAVAGSSICETLGELSSQSASEERELGNILITTRGDNDERILFAEDAERAVGEDADVLGEFALVGFVGDEENERIAVSVAVVDLVRADEFYEFHYLSYGHFTDENIDRSAVIAKRFADARGLSVGDEFSLSVLSEEVTYTVQAIAEEKGLLRDRDVLVSFGGLLGTMAQKIPAIASLGDSFAPCTRLMISVEDGVSVDSIYERLSVEKRLADKNITQTDNRDRLAFWNLFRMVSVYLFLCLILLLAGILITTSLTLLQERRSKEYALFSLAGASERQIGRWFWLESASYSVLGTLLGMLLSIPLTRICGGFYRWSEEFLRVRPLSLGIGVGMTLCLMAICTLRHRRATRKSSSKKPHSHRCPLWKVLPSLIEACLAALCMLLIDVKYCYIAAIVTILLLVRFCFVISPILLHWFASALEKREEKKQSPNATRLLALKQLGRQSSLGFACRLISVLLALISVIGVCQNLIASESKMMTEGIDVDLVAYGLDERTEERIVAEDSMETLRMYYNTDASVGDGINAIAISAEDLSSDFFDEKILPQTFPQADEIILSKGIASLAEVRVGDRISLELGGLTKELTVTEILSVNVNFVYFDADTFGVRRDITCVRLDDADTIESVVSKIESDGATVAGPETVFGSVSQSILGHLALLKCAVFGALILGILGAANLFLRLYRGRKEEMLFLAECGMERKAIRRSYIYEVVFVFLTAMILAAVIGGLICLCVDLALRSFGMILFA
ncbi:MAG: ABC transporter permease [Clostridia bacterium]|nr:ABC transporter permease [Clostridia bacterium]